MDKYPPSIADYITNPEAVPEAKRDILKALFMLNRRYSATLFCEKAFKTKNVDVCKEEIKVTLRFYQQAIADMEKLYPNDVDLPTIKKLLDDLEIDVYNSTEGQGLRLDESLGKILIEKEVDIQQAGIQKIDLQKKKILNKFPKLSQELKILHELGVTPDYLVTTGNPHAATVVLFLEEHIESGSKVAKSSNQYIEKSLTSIVTKGLTKDIYIESVPVGDEAFFEKENLDEKSGAAEKISAKFGTKVHLYGTEYEDLTAATSGQEMDNLAKRFGLKNPQKARKSIEASLEFKAAFFSRATLENIFIAMNVRDGIKEGSSPIVTQVIGIGHEINDDAIVAKKNTPHPLPISHLLAHHGINVLVVDATKKGNAP